MKKTFRVVFCAICIILVSVFFASCYPIKADKVSLEKIEMTVEGRELALMSSENRNSITTFGSEILTKAYDGNNTLISPLSIYLALAMLANSAAGDTLDEMLSVMGLSVDSLNEYCGHLYGLYAENADNKDVVKLANSIWYDGDSTMFVPKTEFLDANARYYGAEIYDAPIDDRMLKDINNWVKKNTEKMIEKMYDTLDPNAVMILLNALAFEDKWDEEFKDTERGDFTDFSGNTDTAEYLKRTLETGYYDSGNAKAFCYSFKNTRFGFLGILPDGGIDSYMEAFDADELLGLLNNYRQAKVHASLPCFSYDYKIQLNDILSAMGMPTMFTEDADFSAGWEQGGNELYVSDVSHKTFVEVSKKGVRAAAVTGIQVCNESALVEEEIYITLDRPFVYAIMDMTYSIPLFIGVTGNVE